MSEEQFEIVIVPEKRIYPTSLAEYNDFGIFAVKVVETEHWDMIEYNRYGNITIKGNMPNLEIGKTYIATVRRKNDARYGLGYEVVVPPYMKPFSTVEEQRVFLSTILTQRQVDSLFQAYPSEDVISLIKTERIDVSLTKGIGEATLKKIKEKIIENEKYQRAIIKLTGEFGIPYTSVKRLSDKYGSPDILLEKINMNPYIMTEVEGFGFKTVDEIALKMGIEKNSPYRIVSCAEYILYEESNSGHCWMKLTELINEAIKLLGISIKEIRETLSNEKYMQKYTIEDDIIYLREFHKYETQIKENVLRILNAKFPFKITNVEETIAEVEKEQGFKFTDEQRQAIDLIVKHNLVIISGKAGTGKTSVIKGIVKVLKTIDIPTDEINSLGKRSLDYATCALSGKASQRIQESTGIESFTIHRLYGYNPKLGGWMFNEVNPLPTDVIILDEGSMVNSEIFYYALRAIKSGAKLIIAGDIAQLEPIGVGNVLVGLLESNKVPKVELTIVHRQAQKSGILSSANKVREGEKFISDNEYGHKKIGELQDLWLYAYGSGEEVYHRVMKIAKKYNGNILDFQIIVPMKTKGANSARNINLACQKIFNQDPNLVDNEKKIERKNVTFLEGDKVILNGNNYDKGVFNGTIGIIKYIDSAFVENGEVIGEIVIDFEGVGEIRFTKSEMSSLDLAYAITVHKSQGSQWKYVVFAMDYSSYVMLNRQLTYTGMTRAMKGLFMVVQLKALQHSIKTNKATKRRTFLQKLMKAA